MNSNKSKPVSKFFFRPLQGALLRLRNCLLSNTTSTINSLSSAASTIYFLFSVGYISSERCFSLKVSARYFWQTASGLFLAIVLSACSPALSYLGFKTNTHESVAIFPVEGESPAVLSTTAYKSREQDGVLDGLRGFTPFGRSGSGRGESAQRYFTAFGLSPNGDMLYVGGEDGSIDRYRLLPANKVERFPLFRGDRAILAISLSPDGNRIAIAQTSLVVVYDLLTMKILHSLTLVKGRITALDWDPRGELLGIGTASGDLAIWSLREGFFEGRGRNSQAAMEYYIGGKSPIVGLRFHPSGATFISAEADGVVSLWRLLRTERELGLRDDFALSDQRNSTNRRQVFGTISQKANDLWFDEEGRFLYVAGSDGRIHTWKVRGLRSVANLEISRDEQFTVSGYALSRDGRLIDLIFSAGRDQRLHLTCRPHLAPGATNGDEMDNALPRVIGRSSLLQTPLSVVRVGVRGHLWAAEKSDRLWVFDANRFFATATGNKLLNNCQQ